MLDASCVMTRFVVTASPDATMLDLAKLLSQHAISGVPIVEADGRLVGVVSEGDLMRQFTHTSEQRRAWWLHVLAEGDDLAPEFLEYVRLHRRVARDMMHTDVVTASEDTPLTKIAELMSVHHIKRVPIVREGKLVGIVTRADLVKAVARRPDVFAHPEA
ncbi:MAG: CBS domain-containing protein [Rhodospirillales bacterium]|nr:CBS domain-containing protein [Rhodospirillales bacterium]MBN8902836.1 CBS domain-containing protein [Rhodospirillales bacterium]